ncbi:hypothetical protein YC2023_052075 [Brassica napus]
MADIKGKGILFKDEPIKLTSQDNPKIFDGFSFSFIGKILNSKKQNVEKLLQKMPSHWGLADRITANDLGNGKFLLNFTIEEDLHSIGSRLGHVDKVEHTKGRMLIDVDTRRPLKFSRKAESPEGDEVTLEIKYEMLFKHCSTCGMLTHEKEYCPPLEAKNRLQPQIERQDVFTRVQIPFDKRHHQASQPRYGNDLNAGRYNSQSRSSRYAFSDMKYEV